MSDEPAAYHHVPSWRTIAARPLAEAERALLLRVVQGIESGFAELRAQLEHARVVGVCECGCRTLALEVERVAPPACVARRLPLEAEAVDADGPVWVAVRVADGYLRQLDIMRADLRPLTEIPPAASIIVFDVPAGAI